MPQGVYTVPINKDFTVGDVMSIAVAVKILLMYKNMVCPTFLY